MNHQVRTIAIVLVVIMVGIPTLVAASNFIVGATRFFVGIEQPITCVPGCDGNTDIEFTLFPGQSQNHEYAITNKSDTNLDGMFICHIDPDNEQVTVEVPGVFIIRGNDVSHQDVLIKADRGAEPNEPGLFPFAIVCQLEAGEYP